jgi:hypothetical protein
LRGVNGSRIAVIILPIKLKINIRGFAPMRTLIKAIAVIVLSTTAPSLSWGKPNILATVKGQCTGSWFFSKNVVVTLNPITYGAWGSALTYTFTPGGAVGGVPNNPVQLFLVTPGWHTLRITSVPPPGVPSPLYSFYAPPCPVVWQPANS